MGVLNGSYEYDFYLAVLKKFADVFCSAKKVCSAKTFAVLKKIAVLKSLQCSKILQC
jgi:hypothetical protein